MLKKINLSKILAITGTVLVWIPLLAPLIFGAARMIQGGHLLIDYLMPAELFFFALFGALLLIWAARRSRSSLRLIAWGLVAAIISLVGSQALAEVTGLASGEIAPTGWQWALVVALLVVYVLALIVIGIGGLLLLNHLFRAKNQPAGEKE